MEKHRVTSRSAGGAFLAIAAVLALAAPAYPLERGTEEACPLATISGSGSLGVGTPLPRGAGSGATEAALPLPDLFVYIVQPVDGNHDPVSLISLGDSVFFKFAIANGGTGYCSNTSIYVAIEMDGSMLDGGYLDVSGLPPSTYTWVYTSIPWIASSGAHTARFTVDRDNVQAETNETNNSKDYSFVTGTTPGLCDLAITADIVPCDTSTNPVSGVVSGQLVLFRFQVANIGTGNPTPSSVAITVTMDGAGIGGGNYNLSSLPPGYYINFYSGAWAATPGSHHVFATVDAWNSQAEIDETNNGQSYDFTVASTCAVSCSASVPASGQAGSAVAFAGTVTLSECSSNTVAWDWNYGDGSAHGSLQSPAHTYAAAGTYAWSATVTTPEAGSCTRNGTIVIAASCTTPVIDTQPQDVTIQPGTQTILTVGAVGTPLVYQWYHGSSGDLTRPIGYANSSWYTTEVLEETTTYWVRVYNGCGYADSRSVRVTVNGGGANCTGTPVFVAAAAHSPGVGNTLWQTDLSVFNREDSTVSVWLRFFARDNDNATAPCVSVGTIPGRSGLAFDDAILQVFGSSSAAGGIGVYLDLGMPLVGSRTYTAGTAGGTYGQSIAGRTPSEGIAAGGTRTLLQLEESTRYRTNLGLQNGANGTSVVEVKLYAENGALLGTRSFTLLPYSQHQEGQIFLSVTSSEVRNGRAEVRVVSGGPVFAYSSVVDMTTGDPSYSEPKE